MTIHRIFNKHFEFNFNQSFGHRFGHRFIDERANWAHQDITTKVRYQVRIIRNDSFH